MFKKIAFSVFFIVMLNACGAASPTDEMPLVPAQTDKIIGPNDLVKVNNAGSNIPSKYTKFLDAFGRMSMGCSATHIGNGLVISAGHCFNGQTNRINNATCANVTVSWGKRGTKTPYLVSKCEKILAYQTSSRVDYSIFKVSPAPTAKVEIDLRSAALNKIVTIFGHPQGRPLEWSKTCKVLSNRLGSGLSNAEFLHQCDTEPGNSGSTIIDDVTLKVVAIHDGGLVPYNYGTYLSSTPLAELLRSMDPIL